MAAATQGEIPDPLIDTQRAIASLLVLVAKADRVICAAESGEMLQNLRAWFDMSSADTLELLTGSVNAFGEPSQLAEVASCLNASLSLPEKQRVLLLLLKLIAADGRQKVEEIEAFSETVRALDIPAGAVHEVFDEYFRARSNSVD